MCALDYCVCVRACVCAAYVVQLLISLRLFFSFSDLVFIIQQIVKIKLVRCCSDCL